MLADDTIVQIFTEHHRLLLHVVQEQFGSAAGAMVELLFAGPLTLKEISDELQHERWKQTLHAGVSVALSVPGSDRLAPASVGPQQISSPSDTEGSSTSAKRQVIPDATVKHTLALLVQHRVCAYNSEARTYRVLVGYALLVRCLYPALLVFLYRRHGDAADTILDLLFQYAVLPWGSLVALSIERRPDLSQALQCCLGHLLQEEVLEFLPLSDFDGRGRDGDLQRKRPREDAAFESPEEQSHPTAAPDAPTPAILARINAVPKDRPCRLNVERLLVMFFQDAIINDYAATNYVGPYAGIVCQAFFELGEPRSHLLGFTRPGAPTAAISTVFPPPPPTVSQGSLEGPGDGTDPYRPHGFPQRLPPLTPSLTREELFRYVVGGGGGGPLPSSFTEAAMTALLARMCSASGGMLLQKGLGDTAPQGLGAYSLPSAASWGTPPQSSGGPAPDAPRGDDDDFLPSYSTASVGTITATPSGWQSSLSSSVSANDTYRLSVRTAQRAIAFSICEAVVFARHGVLGVRLMKLLITAHFLEDKTLAEEAIATHNRTRMTLHAMLKDGYVRLQEIPKSSGSAASASAAARSKAARGEDGEAPTPAPRQSGATSTGERAPKHSLFLWTLSFERDVLPNVKRQLVMTLLNARARLQHEQAVLLEQFPRGLWNAAAAATVALTPSASTAVVPTALDSGLPPGPSDATAAWGSTLDGWGDVRQGKPSIAAAVLRILAAKRRQQVSPSGDAGHPGAAASSTSVDVGVDDAVLHRFMQVERGLQFTTLSLMRQILLLEYV